MKPYLLLAAIFLLLSFEAKSQLTNSLEEYYKLDESIGTAVDQLAHNNSSSVSATYNTGKIGNCYVFNGSTNKVTFSDNANWTINQTDNLSFSAWINFTGNSSAHYQNIWGYSSGPCFFLKKISDNNYQLGWYAGGNESLSGTITFTIGSWYHVVMTRTGSSELKIYLNGALLTTTVPSDVNKDPVAVYIGGDDTEEDFYGKIDELGIWKRALTSAEVTQLYNSGNGLPYTSFGSAPTVTTTAVSSITATTANSGGNVTSDGGASVTARGVCWGTSANPTTANSKTTDGTGTGTFTSSIIGLTANTTYHVRAYATNSIGTSYGSDVQLTTTASAVAPTVTTTTPSSITTTTAGSGGNVTSDGGASVTARGVCWSTSANPTTANSKTTDGTGTGTFTSSITGLTANTTYHVRAYATNSIGTSYGSDAQFTTAASAVAPTVTTTTPSSITTTTASSGGNVTSDGGASLTARGVCWSTSANPTTANSKTTDGTGTGSYASSITGLTANTIYHIRAYATNSVGTSYGSDVSFTTSASGSSPWLINGTNIYYSSGNVGIGTANPDPNYKLTVNGKILSLEVDVVSSIASDYVFAPEYKLMPLTELEKYLMQNRHLPGIPSAEEFGKTGQNLGQTDDLLLRKIEELTLYVIEQNKTIEAQNKDIEELKKEVEVLKKNSK